MSQQRFEPPPLHDSEDNLSRQGASFPPSGPGRPRNHEDTGRACCSRPPSAEAGSCKFRELLLRSVCRQDAQVWPPSRGPERRHKDDINATIKIRAQDLPQSCDGRQDVRVVLLVKKPPLLRLGAHHPAPHPMQHGVQNRERVVGVLAGHVSADGLADEPEGFAGLAVEKLHVEHPVHPCSSDRRRQLKELLQQRGEAVVEVLKLGAEAAGHASHRGDAVMLHPDRRLDRPTLVVQQTPQQLQNLLRVGAQDIDGALPRTADVDQGRRGEALKSRHLGIGKGELLGHRREDHVAEALLDGRGLASVVHRHPREGVHRRVSNTRMRMLTVRRHEGKKTVEARLQMLLARLSQERQRDDPRPSAPPAIPLQELLKHRLGHPDDFLGTQAPRQAIERQSGRVAELILGFHVLHAGELRRAHRLGLRRHADGLLRLGRPVVLVVHAAQEVQEERQERFREPPAVANGQRRSLAEGAHELQRQDPGALLEGLSPHDQKHGVAERLDRFPKHLRLLVGDLREGFQHVVGGGLVLLVQRTLQRAHHPWQQLRIDPLVAPLDLGDDRRGRLHRGESQVSRVLRPEEVPHNLQQRLRVGGEAVGRELRQPLHEVQASHRFRGARRARQRAERLEQLGPALSVRHHLVGELGDGVRHLALDHSLRFRGPAVQQQHLEVRAHLGGQLDTGRAAHPGGQAAEGTVKHDAQQHCGLHAARDGLRGVSALAQRLRQLLHDHGRVTSEMLLQGVLRLSPLIVAVAQERQKQPREGLRRHSAASREVAPRAGRWLGESAERNTRAQVASEGNVQRRREETKLPFSTRTKRRVTFAHVLVQLNYAIPRG
eukprot:scaffold1975_cov241-Pinguiococcus_pyrenoidosus.AAC.4